MKSLKRSLCLVLALVMVLGMFGAASAFSDDAQIQYKEAVEVMTGIGAINGYSDGSFGPKGTVTRAEAAKMVAYAVLGADVAAMLPASASSFTDVSAAFSWAIPSIEYLVKQGVINGRGDGTFDPNGEITAYEIGKMLLCALGYGKQGEFVGTGWEINVAIFANSTGIFTGRASGANALGAAASREECALYCFNTLLTPVVVWSKDTETYYKLTDGTEANNNVTIASTVYPSLRQAYDLVNGFNGYNWYYKGKQVSSFYKDENVLGTIYSTYNVTKGQLYSGYKWADDLALIVNGTDRGPIDSSDIAQRGSSTKVSDAFPVNGATISFVDSDGDGAVDKVIVSVAYLAKVTAVSPATPSKDRSITLTVYDTTGNYTATVDTELFAKGDYILITPSSDNTAGFNDPVAMVKAKSITAAPTAYTGSSVSTADGTFAYSTFTNLGGAIVVSGYSFTTTYNFYFDAYNNVIGVEVYQETASALNYIFVTASASSVSSLLGGSAALKVQGMLLDGSVKTYDYDLRVATATTSPSLSAGDVYFITYKADGTAEYTKLVEGSPISAGLYSYTVNDEGKLTLSKVLAVTINSVTTTAAVATANVTITKNSTAVTGLTDKIASSATEVVISGASGLTKYVGYTNFVTQTFDYDPGNEPPVVYVTKGSVITNILVVGGAAQTATSATYAIYLGQGNTTANGTNYNFFVNGSLAQYLVPTGSTAPVDLTTGNVGGTMEVTVSGTTLTAAALKAVVGPGDITFVDPTFVVVGTTVVPLATDSKVYDISAGADYVSTWGAGTLEAGDTVIYITKTVGGVAVLDVAFIIAKG